MEQELTRGTVDPKYTWDVSRIYESDEVWESAFEAAKAQADALAALTGTLSRGKEAVLHALNMENALNQNLGCIYTYAMMKQHEDTTVGRYQAMLGRAGTLVSEAMAKAAFLTPELLSLQEGTLEQYIADPDFADFDAALRAALRQKPHTLSAKEEQLMAMASEVCSVSENIYDMLTDADMDLGKTRDENGKKAKLTDARLHSFLISPDRAVRKAAYTNVMNGYGRLGNAIAAMYAGQVKADIFNCRARGYKNCRESYLYQDEVDESVYDSLIDAVHGGIDTLAEYLRRFKRLVFIRIPLCRTLRNFNCRIRTFSRLYQNCPRPIGVGRQFGRQEFNRFSVMSRTLGDFNPIRAIDHKPIGRGSNLYVVRLRLSIVKHIIVNGRSDIFTPLFPFQLNSSLRPMLRIHCNPIDRTFDRTKRHPA